MCDLCDLGESKGGFILTMCNTCFIPLVVLREHRTEFTDREKIRIKLMFPDRKIRWEMRNIKDHAHCHIE